MDWSQVVAFYDQLTRLDPSPIVALNRAVTVAELDGPEVALALVERLPLTGYYVARHPRRPSSAGLAAASRRRRHTTPRLPATLNSSERAYLSRKRGELV